MSKRITHTIAGQDIRLLAGRTYRASRPFAGHGRKVFPVTITTIDDGEDDSVVVDGLDYDVANRFLDEFNNGKTSFEGRMWA